NLSSNIILNCPYITPQFFIGFVHVLVASLMAKNTDFITAVSVRNDILFLVYFLTCPLRFSMRFVVYTIFLISTGNSRNVVRLSQFFSHPFMAYGYLSFHFLERSFKAIRAACSFGALYI